MRPKEVAPVPLMQLIYTSRPFGFDEGALDDILVSARRNNRRVGITGALICRADVYMQMLEGEREPVTATFGRILGDDRHLDVALIWSGDTTQRLFPTWDMRDDPPQSWMWDRAEVGAGAVRQAKMEAVRSIFARLATEPPQARAAAD